MKICIVSDSHDNRTLLASAVEQAVANGAEAVIHCGDLVAPSTLNAIKHHTIPIHVIHGNNAGDLYIMSLMGNNPDNSIHYHGQDARITLAGKRIFVVHYPHYAQGLALTGDWDLVCCGHNHKPLIKEVKTVKNTSTLLLNPGTVAGVAGDTTYIMGDLETMSFEILRV